MICPECQKEGKKSKVWQGSTVMTAMYSDSYWDENGKEHIHNPNDRATEYRCSKNHQWHITRKNKCPSCNWPEASDER